MNWLKSIFSKSDAQKDESKTKYVKSFDEMYEDIGAFEYHDDGFTISYENFTRRIKWADIRQINVYKVDMLTIDRIDMEIEYLDKIFSISEELPGWYQFVLKTKEIYTTIPKDWDLTIVHPAFAANYRTIFERENLSL